LGEITEAVHSVMCEGNDVLVGFVNAELVVGERLGTVPEGVPLVPLEADLRATAKTLRLKFLAIEKELTLDLRREIDRRRSALLHRLVILSIPWGRTRQENSTGTFKEAWTLAWEPSFAVGIVEASTWGTTLATASGRKLSENTGSIKVISAAIEQALVADLPEILDSLLAALDSRAACEADILALLEGVPGLARAARYGTVRGTDTANLAALAESILVRACAGLAAGVANLDVEAARGIVAIFDEVARIVSLLPGSEQTWIHGLSQVADRRDVPPILLGKAVRLLFDCGAIDKEDVVLRFSRALSSGNTPVVQAGWVEGLLSGDALLLIHDEALISVLDQWLQELPEDTFQECVPLIRRSFGGYQRSERRQLEIRVKGLGRTPTHGTEILLDMDLASEVLNTVRILLGDRDTAGGGRP
jgi:hypothetical protein